MPATLSRPLVPVAIVLIAVGLLAPGLAAAQEPGGDERVVDILQLDGPITPPTVAAITDLIASAEERDAELVIIEIDAPGAIEVAPRELVDPLRAAAVPVAVWVGPVDAEARGTAAFLLAAAHLPAASRHAALGPACPPRVDRSCLTDETMLLAELLTDHGAEVTGGSGTTVTTDAVTAEDAREAGWLGLVVEGLEPLLVELDGRAVTTADGTRELRLRQDEVTIRFHELGLLQRTLHAALDPSLVYFLLVGVLILLLFEVFQPGFGVAGVAALAVAPLAIYGLVVLPVSWWAALLIVAGLALLAVDLAIAGLGLPTVLGAGALTAGSSWLFTSDHPLMTLPLWLIVVAVGFSVLFFVVIMTVVLRAQAGPEVAEVGEKLVGRAGVVRSTMNPEGHVFVAGALWRARWTGEQRGRIGTGTRVRIVDVDGTTLLVDDAEVEEDPDAASPREGADTPS